MGLQFMKISILKLSNDLIVSMINSPRKLEMISFSSINYPATFPLRRNLPTQLTQTDLYLFVTSTFWAQRLRSFIQTMDICPLSMQVNHIRIILLSKYGHFKLSSLVHVVRSRI